MLKVDEIYAFKNKQCKTFHHFISLDIICFKIALFLEFPKFLFFS